MLDAIKEHLNMKRNTELAAFLGVSSQAISNWYARNSFDAELIYTKCLFISADWLLTGQGSMFRGDASKEKTEVLSIEQPATQADTQNEATAYIYKMCKDKDEENKFLIRENATLKERLRQLEQTQEDVLARTQQSADEHRASIEKESDAFTTATSGGSGKDAVHIRRAASLQTSLPAKT